MVVIMTTLQHPRIVNHTLMFIEVKSQCVVVKFDMTLSVRKCNRWRGQLSSCAPVSLSRSTTALNAFLMSDRFV